MKKKQKKMLRRILIALALYIVLMIVQHLFPLSEMKLIYLPLYLIPYFIVGSDVLRKAVQGIANRQPFDESLLMTIATIGAMVLGEYPEGVAVMLFYQIGEFFQSYAVGKSRRSISALMDIRPDYANLERDGQIAAADALGNQGGPGKKPAAPDCAYNVASISKIFCTAGFFTV